ncbi:hypothetical protein X777_01206 [Ooceraea biroi]|uniref:Uncharacterized protein n=1 Tax=Ooceraea biroi TaxID=2015173 RepID=A0A026WT19_OOCBI|nr:hypothetical protein X777_01206 [Ooceraea biroi]
MLNISKRISGTVLSVNYSASTITAMPWPPPMHAEPMPNLPAFRLLHSMSSSVLPVSLSRFLIAGAGPIPIMLGSTPTTEYPTKRASGLRPSALTASSLAKMTALAPSQMP